MRGKKNYGSPSLKRCFYTTSNIIIIFFLLLLLLSLPLIKPHVYVLRMYVRVLVDPLTCCILWKRWRKTPRQVAPVLCKPPVFRTVSHPAKQNRKEKKREWKIKLMDFLFIIKLYLKKAALGMTWTYIRKLRRRKYPPKEMASKMYIRKHVLYNYSKLSTSESESTLVPW